MLEVETRSVVAKQFRLFQNCNNNTCKHKPVKHVSFDVATIVGKGLTELLNWAIGTTRKKRKIEESKTFSPNLSLADPIEPQRAPPQQLVFEMQKTLLNRSERTQFLNQVFKDPNEPTFNKRTCLPANLQHAIRVEQTLPTHVKSSRTTQNNPCPNRKVSCYENATRKRSFARKHKV